MELHNKISIGLIGASGRMGKSIIGVLSSSQNSKLGKAIVRNGSPFVNLDSGLQSGVVENHVPFEDHLEKHASNVDVWIDFSSHTSVAQNLETILRVKKPIVIGSTGLSASDKAKIFEASSHIPILFSPNMSVGVNLLFKLTELATKILHDYHIEILDIHHSHKKDSPGGTTNKLKEIVLDVLGRTEEQVIHGRNGILGERDPNQVAIHSMRAGEVIGEHTVFYFGKEDRLEITHKATDRKVFATGSVKAAEFLHGKKPGMYTMFDCLGI